jgi:hypothetical protein
LRRRITIGWNGMSRSKRYPRSNHSRTLQDLRPRRCLLLSGHPFTTTVASPKLYPTTHRSRLPMSHRQSPPTTVNWKRTRGRRGNRWVDTHQLRHNTEFWPWPRAVLRWRLDSGEKFPASQAAKPHGEGTITHNTLQRTPWADYRGFDDGVTGSSARRISAHISDPPLLSTRAPRHPTAVGSLNLNRKRGAWHAYIPRWNPGRLRMICGVQLIPNHHSRVVREEYGFDPLGPHDSACGACERSWRVEWRTADARALRVDDMVRVVRMWGERHMTRGDCSSVPAVGWRTGYMGWGLGNSAHEHSWVFFVFFSNFVLQIPIIGFNFKYGVKFQIWTICTNKITQHELQYFNRYTFL